MQADRDKKVILLMNISPQIAYDQGMRPFFWPTTHREKLALAQKLAHLLDAAFVIPGINKKVGIDSLAGFIPGFGDLLSFILSLSILFLAKDMGVSQKKLGIMLFNLLMDTGIGLVPILGDLFDVFWKANLYNVKLMEDHVSQLEQAEAQLLQPGMQTINVSAGLSQNDKS